MDCVTCRPLRKQARTHDRLRDDIDPSGQVEERKILEERQSSVCGIGVSSRRFVKDDLGDAQIEILPFVVPPLVSDLLPCRLNKVAARPRGQVTWNRGFDVDTFGHDWARKMLLCVDRERPARDGAP